MTIKNIRFASPIDNYHHCEIQKISLVAMMAICPDLVISQVEEKKLGMKKTQKLCDFLLEKNIPYELCVRHKEVGSCSDSVRIYERFQSYLDGDYSICKNLLLHEKKKERAFLVITEDRKYINMARLKEKLSSGGLRPATEEEMSELLGTYYGNVSLFNIQNDEENQVELVIDQDLLEKDYLAFHPNYNGASIFLKPSKVVSYLNVIDREAKFIDIPVKEEKIYTKEGKRKWI